ncbi:alpha/beta fold hydrolase [Aerosakkonemataceae cyanobacterium BLCC-F50]|uniref:Alpha/beta fold hydrolase n=1 Tax=Floridaenema flaviceps BLCC-F50 TaxID=3153642 RepID=A0ABV4Y301_9CYAN
MPQIKSHPCFLTPTQIRPHFPLFIFLPGMDGTGQLLRCQTAGLEQGFDIRCLAIPPDDLTGWDELTEQVINLIEAELKKFPRQSVYLCGESFGGCLAMKVAVKAPWLFEKIILVNPASSISRRPWMYAAIPLTQWVPNSFYQLGSLIGLPVLAAMGRIAPSDRQALVQAVQLVPQKTSIWRLSLLQQFQIHPNELRRITQPVFLIGSAADRLLPSVSEVQYLVQHFPNAKMTILPDSGHACLLETDVNLYEILRENDFLPESKGQTKMVSSAVS